MKEWICSVMEPLNREWKFIAKQELVRCKDCRFREQRELLREEFKRCKFLGLIKDNDWFCADGRKRDDT